MHPLGHLVVLLTLLVLSCAATLASGFLRPPAASSSPSPPRRRPALLMSTASSIPSNPKVVGMGVTGIDLLAYVDSYPAADAKIRTQRFQTAGGGNAGNTLTALSRLGVAAEIVTKVGDDGYGQMIVDELAQDGLDARRVIRKAGISSPFTYVIVDMAGQTRTCIHTPSEDMTEAEIQAEWLDGAAFLHLDGRNTLAAIKLAQLARERNIPVMLDAEKDRPHLKELVPLCDFLATNTAFPQTFTGSATTEEGMAALLRLGHAKLVFTTLGAQGSMVMGSAEAVQGREEGSKSPASTALPLATHTSGYTCPGTGAALEVVKCAAWPVQDKDIVDTTGAGDAFIGGVIYGLIHGLSIPHLLNLASYVAAEKLKQPGARAGLPWRDAVPPELHLV